MFNILRRAYVACMVLALVALLLAACGSDEQETDDTTSAETVSSNIIDSTVRRISDKIPQVGEIMALPTATPLDGQITDTSGLTEAVLVVLPTVTPTPTRLPGGYLGVVKVTQLNVRSEPGESSSIVASLGQQECVTLLEQRDGWYRIAMPSSRSGWSIEEFIQVVSECPPPGEMDTSAIGGVETVYYSEPIAVEGVTEVSYVGETAEVAQPAVYTNPPMVTNASTVRHASIHECFGSGDDEIREVQGDTPVEVLGKGPFAPPPDQKDKLGEGPYLKIRLWDGQFAWIAAHNVRFDIAHAADISGQCEESDRLDWSSVERPAPTPTTRPMPTPRPVVQPVAQPVSPAMPTPRPVYGAPQYNQPTATPTPTPTPTAEARSEPV